MGVWFNGENFLAIRKIVKSDKITFDEIPDIPKYNERLEDIGLYKRKDLTRPHNLINEFKTIRNYLAGNAKETVNDVFLAQEVINLILCKLHDEKFTGPEDTVRFRAGINESPKDISNRIKEIFSDTKREYSDVFTNSDSIQLDDDSIVYVAGRLQKFSLIDADRDVIADAFELFIGPSLRGAQGQFFTPRNVVKTVIEIINPKPNECVIDPACGSGGFLSECLRHVHQQIDRQGKNLGWPSDRIREEKIKKISDHLRGIERDGFLSKVAKAYMVILGDGRSGIRTEDALDVPTNWSNDTQAAIQLGTFNVVITNPPFGAKIPVTGEEKLSQFELCYNWKHDKNKDCWVKGEVAESQSPQFAFIDRCLDLLTEGGRLGIVLPDGVLGNPTYGYVRQSLSNRSEIIGIIDVPADAFRPSTNTKTHLLFLKKTKKPRSDYSLFLSYALTCGHDKRRNPIPSDDMGDISQHIKKLKSNKTKPSHLGIFKNKSELKERIWLPKYYNVNLLDELQKYEEKYNMVSIGKLIEDGIIEIINNHIPIQSELYGEGEVPFIRTSDISNLEISEDPAHCIPYSEYERNKEKQDIRVNDIVLVRDGTFLIGKTAIITEMDTEIVLQSHLIRLRVIQPKKLSPYLLLGLMNANIVRKQFDSKIFTQSSISTLGKRVDELILPIPKDPKERQSLTDKMKTIIRHKIETKKLAKSQILSDNQNLLGYKNNGHQGNL